MVTKVNAIMNTLQEFKVAAIAIVTDDDYKELLDKYNVMFLGEKFNVITSSDLANYLEKNIDSSITHDDILNILPTLADDSSIKLEPQISLEDANKSNSKISHYMIHLF